MRANWIDTAKSGTTSVVARQKGPQGGSLSETADHRSLAVGRLGRTQEGAALARGEMLARAIDGVQRHSGLLPESRVCGWPAYGGAAWSPSPGPGSHAGTSVRS